MKSPTCGKNYNFLRNFPEYKKVILEFHLPALKNELNFVIKNGTTLRRLTSVSFLCFKKNDFFDPTIAGKSAPSACDLCKTFKRENWHI